MKLHLSFRYCQSFSAFIGVLISDLEHRIFATMVRQIMYKFHDLKSCGIF